MEKYFGTDGIRGIANKELTTELAMKVGKALAYVLEKKDNEKPKVFIGKDTRISSDVLEASLVAGLCSAGVDVSLLGVIATPAVAYITKLYRGAAGVVISASHNPYEHNGIKIFSGEGYKLSDEMEASIEELIDSGIPEDNVPVGVDIGRVRHIEEIARNDYLEYLKNTLPGGLYRMRIAVDCANGSASTTAETLFYRLDADANICFCSPDGKNINDDCGSTHIENLKKRVVEGKYELGLAFDGDADRCIAVDERGEEIDGDCIIGVCAYEMMKRGQLSNNAVVVTVLSNMGLFDFAANNGIIVETCAPGDRCVIEKMREKDIKLGGEQSGHVIFADHSTTGDGQLTGIQFARYLMESGIKCSEFVERVPKFPQIMINCKVPNQHKKTIMDHEDVKKAISEAERNLGALGRVLVRPSGTEALVRVMAEGKDEKMVRACAEAVAKVIDGVVENV